MFCVSYPRVSSSEEKEGFSTEKYHVLATTSLYIGCFVCALLCMQEQLELRKVLLALGNSDKSHNPESENYSHEHSNHEDNLS